MFTNHTDITIFNKKQVGRNELLRKTCLRDVNLHGTAKVQVGEKGLISSDEFIIRIHPDSWSEDKELIDGNDWKTRDINELYNVFTVQKGDYIVIGLVEAEINSLADLIQRYDVLTVISVTNNMSSSPYSRHLKVVCK